MDTMIPCTNYFACSRSCSIIIIMPALLFFHHAHTPFMYMYTLVIHATLPLSISAKIATLRAL